MNDAKEILDRCEHFRDELGVTLSNFCRNIQLSVSAYHAWRSGALKLSEETLSRIDEYLKRYGF